MTYLLKESYIITLRSAVKPPLDNFSCYFGALNTVAGGESWRENLRFGDRKPFGDIGQGGAVH